MMFDFESHKKPQSQYTSSAKFSCHSHSSAQTQKFIQSKISNDLSLTKISKNWWKGESFLCSCRYHYHCISILQLLVPFQPKHCFWKMALIQSQKGCPKPKLLYDRLRFMYTKKKASKLLSRCFCPASFCQVSFCPTLAMFDKAQEGTPKSIKMLTFICHICSSCLDQKSGECSIQYGQRPNI